METILGSIETSARERVRTLPGSGLKQKLMPSNCSDTNWHTMLYLIRCAFAIASNSSTSYHDGIVSKVPATSEGMELLEQTREVFRKLAKDSPKAKVERGFPLGLLEVCRECRLRGWDQGELK